MWGATAEAHTLDVPVEAFQSTLPVWGATGEQHTPGCIVPISIHAPRVGSDAYALIVNHFFRDISIHAPRVGSDLGECRMWPMPLISIHAPRVGSDGYA